MSFDFYTASLCTHEVSFETVTLDASAYEVRLQRPPANNRISLYVDGVQIPQSGLDSKAELPFSRPEPYRIQANKNDLLYVSVGFTAPRFVQLVPGSNVRAKDLASDLQRQLPELDVTVVSGRVVLKSRIAVRGSAFSMHDPRWTDKTSSLPTTARVLAAYSHLGVNPGRFAIGRRLFPAWSVERDPLSPLGDKYIKLEYPIRNQSPFIQASYVTLSQDCRRCFGSRIEFDYVIEDGKYAEARDVDLLFQEFDKFLFTRIGTHWKWGWLGSNLMNRIGGKGSTGNVTMNSLITFDVSQAFQTYQNIKSKQDSIGPSQKVTDAEYPLSLGGINVQMDPTDPTVAIVFVDIVSRSREPVEIKRVVGTPSSFTLAMDPSRKLRLRG